MPSKTPSIGLGELSNDRVFFDEARFDAIKRPGGLEIIYVIVEEYFHPF
jgi:hypothetical protein